MYVAKQGQEGGIWKSKNGGLTWDRIITGGAVTDIIVHPKNPAKIFFTNSGYTVGEKVYAFDTVNGLARISGSLPNVPVNCIVYQTNNPDGVDGMYIGTDIGIFYKDNRMVDWELYGEGLPNVVVNDMEINYQTKKIVVGTFGRGAWQNDIVACTGVGPKITATPNKTEICEGDSLKLEIPNIYTSYRWSNGETNNFIWVKTSGKYQVSVVDNLGCTYTSASFTLAVHSPAQATISIQGDTVFCRGDSVELTANPRFAYSVYQWSNGMTSRVITVKEPGNYYFTGITSDSCKSVSASVTVTVKDAPEKPVITREGNTLHASTAANYQWYLNGTLIMNATGQTLIMNQPGRYQVKTVGENGCVTWSDVFEYSDIKDEEKIEGLTIIIHPNPTNGLTNLEIISLEPKKVHIEITDLQGKSMLEIGEVLLSGDYRQVLDVSKYSAAVYFIKLQIRDKVIFKNFIKE
jgi:hypothetical protein